MYKQGCEYGFSRQDFVRFVNILLDLAFERSGVYTPLPSSKTDNEPPPDFAISAPRVTIRRYQEDDLELLDSWVSDPQGRLFLLTRTGGASSSLEALVDAEDSVFGIVEHEGRPIGTLAYINLDVELGTAELRKLIADPGVRGRGYAKEATQYWLEYGVTNLGLRKIYLNTLDTNLANIRLNEQLGFRVEGLLREECFFDGGYHDILRMGLIVPR